jgi:hypothetical protein
MSTLNNIKEKHIWDNIYLIKNKEGYNALMISICVITLYYLLYLYYLYYLLYLLLYLYLFILLYLYYIYIIFIFIFIIFNLAKIKPHFLLQLPYGICLVSY